MPPFWAPGEFQTLLVVQDNNDRYGEPLLKTGRHSELPISILAADEYLMQANPEAQTVINSFIHQLEEKMQQVTHVDLDATMSEAGYTESTLDNMTEGFSQAIFWYVDLWGHKRPLRI